MPKQNKKTYDIFDIMVDDILEATDEEIINEAIEDGIDIDKEVFKTKRIFNKCRYDVAKKIVEDKKRDEGRTSNTVCLKDARQKINDLIKNNPEALESLTKAARSGEDIPDDDIIGYYEDLSELGFLMERNQLEMNNA